jgi:hypothetical protein
MRDELSLSQKRLDSKSALGSGSNLGVLTFECSAEIHTSPSLLN